MEYGKYTRKLKIFPEYHFIQELELQKQQTL